jgi:hypothetical protein
MSQPKRVMSLQVSPSARHFFCSWEVSASQERLCNMGVSTVKPAYTGTSTGWIFSLPAGSV